MMSFTFQGLTLENILLVCSVLLLVSVVASRLSSAFGLPSLLLFLGIGMLAGSEGPGGIVFDNHKVAFAIGSVCLAFILFDGGMRTNWNDVKPILRTGISLSVFGTFATGALAGIFGHYALNLGWTEALLLGAIVSSTDAAAVFGILRAKSLSLQESLKQTLEFEAGSNDPIAIFLTMAMLMFASVANTGASDLVTLFFMQGGIGLIGGIAGGWFSKRLINSVGLEYEGLYSVLIVSLVLFIFALTAVLGGSGFLAVYVAGVMLNNSELLHKGSITRFLDGIAWVAQILVFLTLGLLVFPSHLLPVWKEGIALGLFMMIVARPLSVLIAAPKSNMSRKERIFVSWVGLRGAAPIILATLPWSVNFAQAEYVFNLVFFVVLMSVIAQGATIPWFASKLGITVPLQETPLPASSDLLPAGFVTFELDAFKNSFAIEKRVLELGLPSGVLLTSIKRDGRFIVPRGDTVIQARDKIHGLARPSNMEDLKALFGTADSSS